MSIDLHLSSDILSSAISNPLLNPPNDLFSLQLLYFSSDLKCFKLLFSFYFSQFFKSVNSLISYSLNSSSLFAFKSLTTLALVYLMFLPIKSNRWTHSESISIDWVLFVSLFAFLHIY